MTISFNSIPLDIRTPGVYAEIDGSKAVSGLPAAAQKILVVGQRLAAGTMAALTPTRIATRDAAIAAFGRGSFGAMMCTALFAANATTETWAIGLDDNGGGTAATQTLTFTGAPTANGTVALMVAGTPVPVGVASGAALATIATAVAAAINAKPDLPVTAASAAGVVTLTCRHKGTAGNDIDVRHSFYQGEGLPAGLALAIAAGAAGATDPDVSTIWAAIGDTQFPTIILPFAGTATLAGVEAELLSRAGPMRMIEGMAYAGLRGTQGALAAIGAARNSMYVSAIGAKASPSHPAAWAASYGATIALFGGNDPARPFQTLPLPGILPPAIGDQFTRQERDLLLRDAISTFTVDQGGVVLIERAITMYQTNAQGLDDIAFLDVNTPLTLFYLRRAVRLRIASKFSRHKLAGDDARFGAGQAIVTPKIIRAELIALFRDLEDAGLVEDLDQFIADIVVERSNTDPNRIDALIPPNIVNQLRVVAARIEFRL